MRKVEKEAEEMLKKKELGDLLYNAKKSIKIAPKRLKV
jgi:hypothetical protein